MSTGLFLAQRDAGASLTVPSSPVHVRVASAARGRVGGQLLSQFNEQSMRPFRAMLRAHGITTADCVHQGVWQPAMWVPVYGHPNAEINDYWARCIAQATAQLAPDLAGAAEAE